MGRSAAAAALATILVGIALGGSSGAQGGVRLEKIGEFAAPTYVAQPPGEQSLLFVVERRGSIKVVQDGKVVGDPFLDISGKVSTDGERGLLSMAFAPDYAQSGRFFVNFTDKSGAVTLQEFKRSQSTPLRADEGSARNLIRIGHPQSNHNGGAVQFGPEGLLYMSVGDGGGGGDPHGNGQKITTLLGKILRIDPNPSGGKAYTIPSSNPFRKGKARPEIYSRGLRNPYRFSFDRQSGAIAIGDVGQDKFEEVDYEAKGKARGANFGWSAFEGKSRFNKDQKAPGHDKPIFVYGRGKGCSITGGYVVRDPNLPSLAGRYVYTDFCKGDVRSFVPKTGKAKGDSSLGLHVDEPSGFGEDSQGRVYLTSLNGPVFRLAPK